MMQFTGLEYLKMDIARSYGLDKATWQERLDWYTRNSHIVEHADTDTIAEHAREAEEPAQFFAGILAMRDTLEGKPSGFLCSLDATASGVQLLSIFSGCIKSASTCNLINTGNREDAYTSCYRHMNSIVKPTVEIPRNAVKDALMTALYGSEKVPRDTFGEDTPELMAFYQTVGETLPGANNLNLLLKSFWQPNNYKHSWILPDGYEVHINVMDTVEQEFTFNGDVFSMAKTVNRPVENGRSIPANVIHSIDGMVVREMGRRCNYSEDTLQALRDISEYAEIPSTSRLKDLQLMQVLTMHEETKFMSAVVLEYLDKDNLAMLSPEADQAIADLISTLPEKPFPVLCIHDCFKFHGNNGNDVRQQYINILAELADADIMSIIATQITGQSTAVNKINQNLSDFIRKSEYAIC